MDETKGRGGPILEVGSCPLIFLFATIADYAHNFTRLLCSNFEHKSNLAFRVMIKVIIIMS